MNNTQGYSQKNFSINEWLMFVLQKYLYNRPFLNFVFCQTPHTYIS